VFTATGKGEKGSSGGSKRGCLPVSVVVKLKHGIENNEKRAHAGDERGLCMLTIGYAAGDRRS